MSAPHSVLPLPADEGCAPYPASALPEDDASARDSSPVPPNAAEPAHRPFPPVPTDREEEVARECARLLGELCDSGAETHQLRIIDADGTAHRMDVPTTSLAMVADVLREIGDGNIVYIETTPAELTLDEAGDILRLSHPQVTELLAGGEIPFHEVGTERRLRYDDVMDYKVRLDAKRLAELAEHVRINQELGLYD